MLQILRKLQITRLTLKTYTNFTFETFDILNFNVLAEFIV